MSRFLQKLLPGAFAMAILATVVLSTWTVSGLTQEASGLVRKETKGNIMSITPNRARPGEILTIDTQFSGAITRTALASAYITFSDKSVVIPTRWVEKTDHNTEITGAIIEVVIPELEANTRPPVIFHSANFQTPPFLDFEVIRPWYLSPWAMALMGVILAIGFLTSITFRKYSRKLTKTVDGFGALKQIGDNSEQVIAEPPGKTGEGDLGHSTPAPEPPEKLISAIAEGNCLLVLGGGIAAQAGASSWNETLIRLAQTINDEDPLKQNINLAIRSGKLEQIAALVRRRKTPIEIAASLQESFGESATKSDIQRMLAKLPFYAYIDLSWNSAFEHEITKKTPEIETVTYQDGGFAQLLRSSQKFFVKLFGDLDRPDTVLITYDELRQALRESPEFARGVSSLATSNRFLFLGVSLESIEAVMSILEVSTDTETPHYAVVPDNNLMEVYQDQYLYDFGVELLPYQATDLGQFAHFVKKLVSAVPTIKKASIESEATQAVKKAYLESLTLKNIGAFSELKLTLDHGWNVLLGNNGCGKTTILRAIGVALCGDSVEDEIGAQSLLRRGDKSSFPKAGLIEIRVGKARYRTKLVKDGQQVKLKSEQYTPLQTGSWVVLGFPAQRGITQRSLKQTPQSGAPNPNINDVLPLIIGTVDNRMDDLRQWLLNTVIRSEGPDSDELTRRSIQIRDKFFSIIQELLVNDDISYEGFDREKWQILVRSNDDVVVPIEDLSQGMNSILAWVGTLVQRIYEIHSDTDKPESRSALVLIDEIDAHLHPAWQMRLIPLLVEHFPNLQVIATTHSALVVGALDPKHVMIAVRDPETRKASVQKPNIDTEGMPADHILTSPLFGLATTRARGDTIGRYVDLLGMEDSRTSEEEEEFEGLKRRVNELSSFGATNFERQITMSVTKALEEQTKDQMGRIRQLSDEEKLELKLRTAEFFETDTQDKADELSEIEPEDTETPVAESVESIVMNEPYEPVKDAAVAKVKSLSTEDYEEGSEG